MRTLTRGLLAALLVLAVAGCGGEDAADSEGDGQPATPDESPAANDDEQPEADSDSGDDGASSGDSAAGDADTDVQAAIEVRGGQVVGGVERVAADMGEKVALTVTSDVADTVHVHGYDLQEPVTPEKPAALEFTAEIPGVFEVELHDSGLKLADVQVGG